MDNSLSITDYITLLSNKYKEIEKFYKIYLDFYIEGITNYKSRGSRYDYKNFFLPFIRNIGEYVIILNAYYEKYNDPYSTHLNKIPNQHSKKSSVRSRHYLNILEIVSELDNKAETIITDIESNKLEFTADIKESIQNLFNYFITTHSSIIEILENKTDNAEGKTYINPSPIQPHLSSRKPRLSPRESRLYSSQSHLSPIKPRLSPRESHISPRVIRTKPETDILHSSVSNESLAQKSNHSNSSSSISSISSSLIPLLKESGGKKTVCKKKKYKIHKKTIQHKHKFIKSRKNAKRIFNNSRNRRSRRYW